MTNHLTILNYDIDKDNKLTAQAEAYLFNYNEEDCCTLKVILKDLTTKQEVKNNISTGVLPLHFKLEYEIPPNMFADGFQYRLSATLFDPENTSYGDSIDIKHTGWKNCLQTGWNYTFSQKMASDSTANLGGSLQDLCFYFKPLQGITVYQATDLSLQYRTSTGGTVPYKGRIFMDADFLCFQLTDPIDDASCSSGLADLTFSCRLTYGPTKDPKQKESSTITIHTLST